MHAVLVFLHLVGMAVVVGGFTSQLSSAERRVTPGQWHGALLALITGLALVALQELTPGTDPLNHGRIAVKLLIGLVLLVLCLVGRRRGSWTAGWLATGLLGLANTAIAVAGR
ncbi:MAG: hypothetical protein ACODUE_06980 [Synechococcus sp.]